MKSDIEGCGEPRLENVVAYLLIVGVVVSLALEIAGLVLYYQAYGNLNILLDTKSVFIQGRNFFIFLFDIFGQPGIHSQAIFFLTLGMTVLILTPYFMVIASLIYFARKRNFRYVFITAMVFIVISVSLSLR